MNPTDLLTIAEAALASNRSEATIRRWLSSGRLARHPGPPPAHGGSPLTLVSREELHVLLVTSNAQPHAEEDVPEAAEPSPSAAFVPPVAPAVSAPAAGVPLSAVPAGPSQAEVDLRFLQARLAALDAEARLRVELAEARAAAQLAALRGELATTQAQAEAARLAASRLEADNQDLRRERDDWRERHDAREAELRAFREAAGQTWLQRLIGVRPVLTEGG